MKIILKRFHTCVCLRSVLCASDEWKLVFPPLGENDNEETIKEYNIHTFARNELKNTTDISELEKP